MLLRARLEELWRARELLRQLVAKELKVRYKRSVLGFLWSLATPAALTLIFTVVFHFVIRIGVEDFPAFLLSGYLVWMYFSTSAQNSIHAIVGNGPLIKKVYFPREVLPLATVLSQLVHFLLALLAVSPYFVVTRGWGVVVHLPAVLLGVLLLTVFTAGVAMVLAAANVTFRDLQELVVVAFLLWFYATPIIYPVALVEQQIAEGQRVAAIFGHVLNLNPVTWFVKLFRETIYGEVTVGSGGFVTAPAHWPSLELVGVLAATSLLVFTLGYLLFQRFALTFAKEV